MPHLDQNMVKRYNIQYPISNIQYPISRTFSEIFALKSAKIYSVRLSKFSPFFCLFSVFFIHLFLSACTDLGTGSSTGKNILRFDTDGGSAVPSVEVPSGGLTLSKTMTAPTKDPSGGTTYYFGDWYTVDKTTGHTGKTKYDYTKPITGSMTLYARWYTEQPADKAALEKLITDLGNTGDFNHIDVRKVTDMSELFQGDTTFNGDITGWDVSNVTNMSFMFGNSSDPDNYGAEKFNQPIGDWDVSGVTNMQYMFAKASIFNQPIGDWDVSGVTNMQYMFFLASEFNNPIGAWNVSDVTSTYFMFKDAQSFNQPIGAWDVSSVTSMNFMFNDAKAFDQDISGWIVTQATDRGVLVFGGSGIRESYKPAGF
ncbi:BspA family leucine-rich repeat surface protein [Candidatus Haliotispira prima]|uniref:BspA family leucine-rich repeat surface protein n=1 Tax=Candidatus Haliotispira prima TaxID=3034016 RepID=A0ABY8ML07_9SPIO|nr:BspA family leucine-rich repeat surface protein [Candidatus Haliotispira prima]